MQASIRVRLDPAAQAPHLYFQHPTSEWLCPIPRVRKYILAFRLGDQVLQDFFDLAIDQQLASPRAPLQPPLDRDLTISFPDSVGFRQNAITVFHQHEHFTPAKPGIACHNRSRSQRLFGLPDPLLVIFRAEHIVGFTLRPFVPAVLFDDRHRIDQLQFAVRISQRLSKCRQITVHCRLSHRRWPAIARPSSMLQCPRLEPLDVSFVDLVQANVRPGAVRQQLAIAFPVEHQRAFLFGLGDRNPVDKGALEFAQGGNRFALLFFGCSQAR
jgi:hypothetical protein